MAIYFLVKNTEAYINGGLQYEIETSTASLKVSWVFVVCYSKILWQKLKMQDFAIIIWNEWCYNVSTPIHLDYNKVASSKPVYYSIWTLLAKGHST